MNAELNILTHRSLQLSSEISSMMQNCHKLQAENYDGSKLQELNRAMAATSKLIHDRNAVDRRIKEILTDLLCDALEADLEPEQIAAAYA